MLSWLSSTVVGVSHCIFNCSLLCLFFAATMADAKMVTARGLSEVDGDNIVEARRLAIEAAKREAVEQAVGTFIRTRTDVNNYLLAKDQIYSTTAGQITQFSYTKDGVNEDGIYEVVIEADVQVDEMLQQVQDIQNAYGWSRKPRISVRLNDATNNIPVANAVKTNLHKKLKREGFDVFDSNEAVHAGFIMDVLTTTQSKTDNYQGIVITANDLNVTFSVSRVGDNQILASAQGNESKPGIKTGQIYAELAKRIVNDAWPSLKKQTVRFWKDEQLRAKNLVVEVSGVESGAQAEKIRLALLDTIPAIQTSQLVELKRGKATFSVEYKGWAEQMYEAINSSQFNYKSNVTLTGVNGNKILAKLG